MKPIKQIEDILPITFKKAKYSANCDNSTKKSKKIATKYLNSKMVLPQNFYKPISKMMFCALDSK